MSFVLIIIPNKPILLSVVMLNVLAGRGKITYTFSANANEFPFCFCLTHPPRLLVPRKTEY